jgi:hypothetical protein
MGIGLAARCAFRLAQCLLARLRDEQSGDRYLVIAFSDVSILFFVLVRCPG